MNRRAQNRTTVKFLTFALIALLSFSCGKKNKVKSSDLGDNGSTNNPGVFNNGAQYTQNTLTQSQIRSITNNIQCTYGSRMQQVVNYNSRSSQGAGQTNTTIIGPFQPGNLQGSISKLYVGRSSFGDVMIVGKLTNGAQVVGYNITISFCEFRPNGYPLITNDRRLENFNAPMGITIDEDIQCGYGNVDSALYTSIISQPNGQYPYPYEAVTTFIPYCGQF